MSRTVSLTPRQAKVLAFLRERIAATGVGPSFVEIAEHLGIRSKSAVWVLMDALEQRGAIRRPEGRRARAVQIVGVPTTAIAIDPLPEVRRALTQYAADHCISEKVAAEEALRAYFVGAAP